MACLIYYPRIFLEGLRKATTCISRGTYLLNATPEHNITPHYTLMYSYCLFNLYVQCLLREPVRKPNFKDKQQ